MYIIHIHVYIHTCVRTHAHMYICTAMHVHMKTTHMNAHLCAPLYIHELCNVYTHSRAYTYARTYIHTPRRSYMTYVCHSFKMTRFVSCHWEAGLVVGQRHTGQGSGQDQKPSQRTWLWNQTSPQKSAQKSKQWPLRFVWNVVFLCWTPGPCGHPQNSLLQNESDSQAVVAHACNHKCTMLPAHSLEGNAEGKRKTLRRKQVTQVWNQVHPKAIQRRRVHDTALTPSHTLTDNLQQSLLT
jgi:hypothetical protein